MDEKHCEGYGNAAAPLFKGLAVMFVLIGLAVFASSVLNVLFNNGSTLNCMSFGSGMGGLWGLIDGLIAICVVLLIFKIVVRRHGHYGCNCGCGYCGSDARGSCNCGDDCNCVCHDADDMDKKGSRKGRGK